MAKIVMNPLVNEVSKKLDNVVLFHRNGKNFFRNIGKKKRKNPRTAAQRKIRYAFRFCIRAWKKLGAPAHGGWNMKAAGSGMSGFNAFIKANAVQCSQGETLELTRDTGETGLQGIQAAPGAGDGEILVSFPGTVPAGKHLTLFTHEVINSLNIFLEQYDMGKAVSSPVSIPGLQAGKEYFVYAVVSDAKFADAARVSASAACKAFAGKV